MSGAPTDELLQRVADRLKALADPMRLRILHALEDGEHNVTDLLHAVGGSQTNVSKHLARMRHAGLVEARREGTNVYYSVADPTAFAVCRTVCDGLEQRAKSERALLRGAGSRLGGHR